MLYAVSDNGAVTQYDLASVGARTGLGAVPHAGAVAADETGI